jgi:hypothetical protein
MRRWRFILGLVLAAWPAVSGAQPRWDLTGAAGLFAGGRPVPEAATYGDDWFESVQGGVIVGRHLTTNLKIQVEATGSTAGSRYISRPITVPGAAYPQWLTSEVRNSVTSAGAVVAWQFRENEWVHPFVEAGVTVDVDRVRLLTPEQFSYGDSRGAPPERIADAQSDDRTTTRAHPVIGGGAKLYFNQRAFVRTDARVTLGSGYQNLAVRAGVGFDF